MNHQNVPVDGALFAALVVDQLVSVDSTGALLLLLTLQTTAVVTDEQDPAVCRTPCPPQECEVRLAFPAADQKRLDMSLKTLSRLGVGPADLPRLHPDHPNAVKLTGTQVYVRPRTSGGFIYWNIVTPRERPRPVAVGALAAATATLLAKLGAVRGEKSPPGGQSSQSVEGVG